MSIPSMYSAYIAVKFITGRQLCQIRFIVRDYLEVKAWYV